MVNYLQNKMAAVNYQIHYTLGEKTITVTATKDGVVKSGTDITSSAGFLGPVTLSFTDSSDGGTWTITYSFAGDSEYAATSEFGNGATSYTLAVPDPPVPAVPDAPYTITDDSTGGDCQYIGNWNSGSKTCTLTYTSTDIHSTGHGIIIDGHDITLDGSSNKIYGDGGSNDFGVDARNSDNFTIKNLHIKEFGIGIRAGNSNGGTITSVNLLDNSVDGLYAEYVTALKVTSNNISSNGRNGITLNGGSSSALSCSVNNSGAFVVQGNWVASNTGNGIEAFNHSGICFDQNTANVNDYGFYVTTYNNDLFYDNTANSNTNTGFYFASGATPATFTGNTASGNGVDFEGVPDTTPPVNFFL